MSDSDEESEVDSAGCGGWACRWASAFFFRHFLEEDCQLSRKCGGEVSRKKKGVKWKRESIFLIFHLNLRRLTEMKSAGQLAVETPDRDRSQQL